MSNDVSITIKICNRNYKIKVASENEQFVRDTINQVTQKISDFHKNFPGRDDQDYMAMTLIDHITRGENIKNPADTMAGQDTIQQKLLHLQKLLD